MEQGYNQIKKRFDAKVYPEPNTGCWLWGGPPSKNGYGQFMINYKGFRAHRVAYMLYKNEIPEGLVVCHSCDNTSCVNPDHLWLGTHADNVMDRVKKGRSAIGSKNANTKLMEHEVLAIRQSNDSSRKLAKKFNVDRRLIMFIKQRKVWKHI